MFQWPQPCTSAFRARCLGGSADDLQRRTASFIGSARSPRQVLKSETFVLVSPNWVNEICCFDCIVFPQSFKSVALQARNVLFSLRNLPNQHNQIVINIYIRWLSKSESVLLFWIRRVFFTGTLQRCIYAWQICLVVPGVLSTGRVAYPLALRTGVLTGTVIHRRARAR